MSDHDRNRSDPNVLRVINKMRLRSEAGLKKYGVDTTRKDLSVSEWLIHLQEELMDAAVYVERLIDTANKADIEGRLDELHELTEHHEVRNWPRWVQERKKELAK